MHFFNAVKPYEFYFKHDIFMQLSRPILTPLLSAALLSPNVAKTLIVKRKEKKIQIQINKLASSSLKA